MCPTPAGNVVASKRAISWDKDKRTHNFSVAVEMGSLGTRVMAVRVLDLATKDWTEWSTPLHVDVAEGHGYLQKGKPAAHRHKLLKPSLPADYYRGKLKDLKERKEVEGSIFVRSRSLDSIGAPKSWAWDPWKNTASKDVVGMQIFAFPMTDIHTCKYIYICMYVCTFEHYIEINIHILDV